MLFTFELDNNLSLFFVMQILILNSSIFRHKKIDSSNVINFVYLYMQISLYVVLTTQRVIFSCL